MQRQQFELQTPRNIDIHSYTMRSQGRCPPILNLLIIGSSLVIFAYVNTQFVVELADAINGSVYDKTTQTFDCNDYYCDQTAYNFIYFYSNYLKCNTKNCLNIICDGYDCKNSQQYNINYYYACQPGCPGSMEDQNAPNSLKFAYIMAITIAVMFGLGFLINIAYGLFASFYYSGLSRLQRFGLIFGFVWPDLKYYAFRKRKHWEDFQLAFKPLVVVEIVINVCYGVPFNLYIVLYILGYWQSPSQITNLFLLILAYGSRISMLGEIYSPFCRADRELYDLKANNSYN